MAYGRIHPSAQEDKSKYNETVHAFVISSVILFINTLIIRILYGINIMSAYELSEYIKIPNNFIIFFGITLILIIPGIPIYGWIIDSGVIKIVNMFRKGKAKESKHLSPWHAVFDNEKFSLDGRPVSIFKGKELVTIGYLDGWPAADQKKKDFVLINTWLFKELYYADKEKDRRYRLFDLIDAEYYDSDNDMLIKFYNKEYITKYLKEHGYITSEGV